MSSRNSPRQHTNWDHSEGLLLQPSVDCWVPGVIESVFECSGPNSNSTVTLTRSIQWKNSLTSPFFIQLCSSGRFGQWRLQYWLLLRKLLLKEYNHKDKWYCAQCRAQRLWGGGNDVWKPWKRNIEAERLPESHKIIVKFSRPNCTCIPICKSRVNCIGAYHIPSAKQTWLCPCLWISIFKPNLHNKNPHSSINLIFPFLIAF